MKIKTFLILLVALVFATTAFKCGGTKNTGGGAKSDWEHVLSVSSSTIPRCPEAAPGQACLPLRRPPQYTTPKGARYYFSGFSTPIMAGAIDEAIDRQFARSNRPNPNWSNPNIYQEWDETDEHREYDFLFLPPTRKSQNPDTFGCPLIDVWGQTVIGLNIGMYIRNGQVVAPGGVYLTLPEPDMTRPECLKLWGEGLDNESEHRRMMPTASLWLFYTGANDIHKLIQPDAQAGTVERAAEGHACAFSLLTPERFAWLEQDARRRLANGEISLDIE